jgi:hypothetical protein
LSTTKRKNAPENRRKLAFFIFLAAAHAGREIEHADRIDNSAAAGGESAPRMRGG